MTIEPTAKTCTCTSLTEKQFWEIDQSEGRKGIMMVSPLEGDTVKIPENLKNDDSRTEIADTLFCPLEKDVLNLNVSYLLCILKMIMPN